MKTWNTFLKVVSCVIIFTLFQNVNGQLFFENFDSNWTSNSAVHSPAPTLRNWTSDVDATNARAWHRNDYTVNWSPTEGSPSATGANGTTYYARFHSRALSNNQSAIMYSPVINLSAYVNQDVYLSFYYINLAGNDFVNIDFSNNGDYYATYRSVTTATTWTRQTIKIPRAFLTNSFRFSITGVSSNNNGDNTNADIGLDQVEIYTPMTITSSRSTALCSGESATLTANMPSIGSGTTQYTWSPSTGLNTTTGATVIASPTSTTTYTVTSTRNGYSHTQTITVGVSPLPETTITAYPENSNSCNSEYTILKVNAPDSNIAFSENFSTNPAWSVFGVLDNISGRIYNSNDSGGTAPEAGLYWVSGSNLYSDWYFYPNDGNIGGYRPISLLNFSEANLQFKYYFDSYDGNYERNIAVEVSTDLENWKTVWQNRNFTTSIPATTISNINLNNFVGSIIYLRFKYSGDSYGLDYFLIDDIIIDGVPPTFSYSPHTGLYLDSNLSTPYNGTGSPSTLYTMNDGTTNYTITSTYGSCIKTASQTITNNASRFYANNGNWDIASNWRPEVVPNINKCVFVPNGKNIFVNTNDAQAKTINIAASGNLTINSDAVLTVKDEIINQGSGDNFILESDANLLQTNPLAVNIGNMRAERFVQDMNNILPTHMDYVYWSSPVTGQAIHDGTNSIFSPGTPRNRNYEYRESNDYFYPTADQTFKKGKGYAIRAETGINPETGLDFENGYDKTYKFTGIPNNGTILSEEVIKYTDAIHGHNMIGNPYPSNLNLVDFLSANSSKIEYVAHFWTNNTTTPYQSGTGYTGNSYAYFNALGGNAAGAGPSGYDMTDIPNGIVKVGQGFLVKAKPAGNNQNLVFENNLRSADAGSFYQKNTEDRFWLTLTSPDQMNNMMLIGYNEDATDGFEMMFDAPLVTESSDAIYSLLNDQKLAINGLAAPFSRNDIIPIGFKSFKNGVHRIQLFNAEGVFIDHDIFIKDKYRKTIHNLKQSPFEFKSGAGEFNDRFEIVFKRTNISASSSTKSSLADKPGSIIISSKNNAIFASVEKENIIQIDVYDLFGKLLFQSKNINSNTYLTPQQFKNQIVFVNVITESGLRESKKIIFD